jgi:hypothetical protein
VRIEHHPSTVAPRCDKVDRSPARRQQITAGRRPVRVAELLGAPVVFDAGERSPEPAAGGTRLLKG